MKVHDLKSLTQSIQKTILFIFIVLISLFTIICLIAQHEIKNLHKYNSQREINATIHLFQSNISEKLSIIANSPVFIDFINSGEATRKSMYLTFLTQALALNSDTISGMEISGISNKVLFQHGKKTEYFTTLKLCYLNRQINNKYGNCDFFWKLYFNKQKIINKLINSNQRISECTKCQLTTILDKENFGSFAVQKTSGLQTGLTILNNDSIFIFLFIFFIGILFLLTSWIFLKVNKIFNNYLNNPIQDITKNLKFGKVNKNKNYIEELNYLTQEIELYHQNKDKIKLGAMAAQVAHDIRSPLAALDMILQDLSQLSEEKRIITRNAIYRIKDIANNLLHQHRTDEHNAQIVSACLLNSLIESLISEKRIQYRSKLNIQIGFIPGNESYGLFSNINLIEFKRVLSNLINNAIEALGEEGQVTVTLGKNRQSALIKIIDNGPGIPDIVLQNLGIRGNTYGKKEGAGLGLSHAIESLNQWQGKMQIENSTSEGTTISIYLPLTDSPEWFLKSLNVQTHSNILILDDDATIHQIWNERFEKLQLNSSNITWYHFSNKAALSEWFSINLNYEKPLIVLCDYEIIDQQENGLDIIESLQIADHSILVTSRYEQPEIQTRCNQLNIPLLPKSLAMLVPINIISDTLQEKIDLILLDDDELIRSMWELSAKMKNLKIKTFSNFKQLEEALSVIEKNTPIYLDYSLNENLTGIEVAEKLRQLNYTELYLTTGYEGAIDFNIPTYIKAVVSKDFP